MCELFAVSGKTSVPINEYMTEFAAHSTEHPNGWGIASFFGNAVSLEKEPTPAYKSTYLKGRLRHKFDAKNMMAHIRLATRGNVEYENCHPFVKRDVDDRAWTLMHNGTIFHCDKLNEYVHSQEGTTDSERILCHVIAEIDRKTRETGHSLDEKDRFETIDQIVLDITPGNNKVNLVIYDGEYFYVHTNMAGTLYMKKVGESVFFATVPLDMEGWEPVPFMQLLVFRDGSLVYEGTKHTNEYIYNENDMKYIFMDYSAL